MVQGLMARKQETQCVIDDIIWLMLASSVCTCKSHLGSELGLLRTDYHTITRRQHVPPALACISAFAFIQHRYDMSGKDVLIPSCH